MVNGSLVKLTNLIKWTIQLNKTCDTTEISESFEIQDSKCTFLFYSGQSPAKPISLSINIKEKLSQSIDIILISSNSKNESFEKHTVTGEHEQVIWSSFHYGMRGSLFTFEMVIYNAGKDDKYVQTPTYINTRFSLEDSSKDFAKLLDDGPNHDVEFVFGDQTIKAHKSILSCRSDVFTSMLQSKMVEGETGRVNIQDMDATVFQQFLQCLYTGMLPQLTVDIAVQLYTASDKYAVNALKLQCAEFLVDNLSLENACEILSLADRHNDPEFKKGVMEYVFKEKIPVVGEKWTDFSNENQKLAMEVLNSFCRYLCQN